MLLLRNVSYTCCSNFNFKDTRWKIFYRLLKATWSFCVPSRCGIIRTLADFAGLLVRMAGNFRFRCQQKEVNWDLVSQLVSLVIELFYLNKSHSSLERRPWWVKDSIPLAIYPFMLKTSADKNVYVCVCVLVWVDSWKVISRVGTLELPSLKIHQLVLSISQVRWKFYSICLDTRKSPSKPANVRMLLCTLEYGCRTYSQYSSTGDLVMFEAAVVATESDTVTTCPPLPVMLDGLCSPS